MRETHPIKDALPLLTFTLCLSRLLLCGVGGRCRISRRRRIGFAADRGNAQTRERDQGEQLLHRSFLVCARQPGQHQGAEDALRSLGTLPLEALRSTFIPADLAESKRIARLEDA